MDTFWIILITAIALLILLMALYDRLINLAFLKKTEWARVYDKKSYTESAAFGVNNYAPEVKRFGVTFKMPDGSFKWLLMSESEFMKCDRYSVGKLTYRGNSFISFEPGTPPHKVLREMDDD